MYNVARFLNCFLTITIQKSLAYGRKLNPLVCVDNSTNTIDFVVVVFFVLLGVVFVVVVLFVLAVIVPILVFIITILTVQKPTEDKKRSRARVTIGGQCVLLQKFS